MKFKTEYVLFGILALVVVYALTRIKAPEVQQVPEFIGSANASQTTDANANLAAKLNAFTSLAGLGASQTNADLQRYQTDAQLEATREASRVEVAGQGMQERLQAIISGSAERLQSIISGTQLQGNQQQVDLSKYSIDSQERQAAAGYDFQRFALPLNLDLSKYGIDTQLQQYLAGLGAQQSMYQADLANRLATIQTQIGAVNSVGQTYRNQSLERQGTILNALSQIWGGGSAYTYQNSFGKTNTSVLQQLFPQGIGQTATSILGGFFGF